MTSWITLLPLCLLAAAAIVLSANSDPTECLKSLEDCEGKPEGKTAYPKCGECDRFIRCRRKAKEILCPPKKPVFDVSLKCKPKDKATCASQSIAENAANHTTPKADPPFVNSTTPASYNSNVTMPISSTT